MNNNFNLVIIIPCYRHVNALLKNIERIQNFHLPIIIVDDGNNTFDADLLKKLESRTVRIIRNEKNSGKGGSMTKAFFKAYELGYTHALQIDSDGQPDINQIASFSKHAEQNTDNLICGKPKYTNIPIHRYIGRFITHFWVSIELGIPKIIDSMCGIRVYPLKATVELLKRKNIGTRMSFDTEILVRLYWAGTDFKFYDVDVFYPSDGISNFAPFRDNLLISLMHAKLCIEKIFYFKKISRREYY